MIQPDGNIKVMDLASHAQEMQGSPKPQRFLVRLIMFLQNKHKEKSLPEQAIFIHWA